MEEWHVIAGWRQRMEARRLQLKHFAGAGVFYSDFEELPSQSPKTVAEYREALVLRVPAPLGCFQLVGGHKRRKDTFFTRGPATESLLS